MKGWNLPRPDFWLLAEITCQETLRDASERAAVRGSLTWLPRLPWEVHAMGPRIQVLTQLCLLRHLHTWGLSLTRGGWAGVKWGDL